MHAGQMLDNKADLLARLTQPDFSAFVQGVMDGGQNSHGTMTRQESASNSQVMSQTLPRFVKFAECYRVSADMAKMVEHFAGLLDDTDIFMPDLAPSECGMAFFESPLPIQDVRGRVLKGHWLVWGKTVVRVGVVSTVPAVQAYWFNDHRLSPDEVGLEIMANPYADETLGRWGFMGADVFHTGREVGPALETEMPDDYAESILADGDTPSPFTNPLRYVHALWMLLGQSIVSQRLEDVDRMSLKRAERAQLIPRVTVVELRRVEGGKSDRESPVDWSHRWLVRGHMRWQPYGKQSDAGHDHVVGQVEVDMGHSVRRCQVEGCEFELRRIAILPYVKGPEGKPLRLTEHVYAFNR